VRKQVSQIVALTSQFNQFAFAYSDCTIGVYRIDFRKRASTFLNLIDLNKWGSSISLIERLDPFTLALVVDSRVLKWDRGGQLSDLIVENEEKVTAIC